jgi:GT2 family glycosyltransferase
MAEPTLALCIPAYNAERFLPRLLNSALKQTVPFDEILVYNDCSTDKTAHVAQEYGAKVVQGDVNHGCSYGKNKLAEFSQCDWIHYHDADDELLPNFTTLAHKWMSLSHPPDVVLFDYEYRDNDANALLLVKHFEREELERDPISYAIREQINSICGLYKRGRLLEVGGYDLDPLVLYNEDVAFHCKLAICGLSFSAEPEVSIINYRIGGSMSASNPIKCTQAHYHVLRKVAEKVGAKYPAIIASKLWANAGVAASFLDWGTADASVKLALLLDRKMPESMGALFKGLCKMNPFLALRIREYLIRILKPSLRNKNGK